MRIVSRKMRVQQLFLLLLITPFIVVINRVYSQENDFQIWSDMSSKYKINKKIKLSAEFGLRSRENSQFLKQFYAEIGAKYKVNKRFNTGLKYRFTNYYYHNKLSSQRFNLDAEYSFKKWNRFRLAIRERLQYEWLVHDKIFYYDEINLRSRMFFTYNIKKSKLKPFFSFEHYWGLSGQVKGLSTQIRWSVGLNIPVNKWSDFTASYRIIQQLNRNNPLTIYAVLVSYKINLN